MKKIDTSNITDTQQLNLLGRTLDFIQENVQEQATSLAYSAMNSAVDSAPIALYGCIGTYSTVGFANDTYTITKGAILYNGEIYQVPAMVATRANIGETIVFRIDTSTYQAGEPTPYTDGTPRNTNQIRAIKIYNGATGSGIVDAVNLKYYNSSKEDTTVASGIVLASNPNVISGSATITSWNIKAEKRGDSITLYTIVSFTPSTADLTIQIPLLAKYQSKNLGATAISVRKTDGAQQLFGHQSWAAASTNNFINCAGLTSGNDYNALSIVTYTANEIG